MATPFNQGAPTIPVVLNTSNCFVFGNTASGNALSVQQLGAGNVATFRTTTGATALFVNAAGNVGVGTTNPAASLGVTGNIYASNAVTTTNVFTTNVFATGRIGIGTTNPGYQLTVSSNIYNQSSGGGFYGMNCGNLDGLIQGVYNGGAANPDGLANSDMFIGVNYNQQTGQRLAGTNHGVAQIQLVGANPGSGNIKFRCAAGGTGALASVPVVATITTTGLQIGGTGVTGNVLQLGNFTFQMVSYQGLFGIGTVTYTPSSSGIFVAFFASDTLVFTSTSTSSGQYSAVTTYLNSASLTGNTGLGQLSLSTAVNGVLTATFKNTGDFMRVFRMAF